MKTLYLDVDGVLANFVGGFLKLIEREDYTVEKFGFYEDLGMTTYTFWQIIDEQGEKFWRNLKPYPWKDQLLKEVRAFKRKGNEVFICTSPSRHPSSWSGKKFWLDMHAPGLPIFMCNAKHKLAKEGALLVDDHDKNCEDFEEGGGRSLLFPQTWNGNRLMLKDRVNLVKEFLAESAPPF